MKKKEAAILVGIIAFILLLGGIVFFWVWRYQSQGVSEIQDLEGEYRFNGKLLIPEEGEEALRYVPYGNQVFERVEKREIDLAPYGFEGKVFDYYRVESTDQNGLVFVNYYPSDPAYEPFWPVCMGDRFVYVAEDGKKIRIHPDEELSYPIFADSVEGVDPYGSDVIAFSANASYAIALDGVTVKAYKTDPKDDSLRVVEVKEYSLAKWGTKATFGAFVGVSTAWFSVEGKEGVRFVVVDFAAGETALSHLEYKGDYSEGVSRLFVQRFDVEGKKEGLVLAWSHILLGEERHAPESFDYEEGRLLAVSPSGTYAVFSVKGEGGEDTLVTSEKRSFALGGILKDGETLERVDFLYDNILLLTLEREDGSVLCRVCKICF